tara:strand:- start:195 stop:353 length:159 start_codon:yes stop_codon:yes gene_type:complete
MKKEIRKCRSCKKYTLKEICCGKTLTPKPAKYSPEDKYSKYRRKYKKNVQNK